MGSQEDLSFAEYRRTRDPQRLAEVFDLTALDLLHLALHLVPDPAAAEDLVQSTFVAAIESAHRHHAGRPVMPWLVGILVNHGRAARRKTRKTVDPDRLPRRGERGPHEHAEAEELSRIVARAIEEVPPLYREVLALRLELGLSTVAIALKLRRAPGTVRSQLWRALDLVRRTLPRGAAPALSFPGVRGLASLRGDVLAAASVPAKSISLPSMFGGLMAVKTIVLSLVGIGAVLAGLWIAARPELIASIAPAVLPVAAAREIVTDRAAESRRLERAAAVAQEPAVAGSGQAASTPPSDLPPVLVAPYLVSIRVVDQRGAPVPDAEVALSGARRVRTSAEPGHVHGGPVEGEQPLAATRTDASGQCTLQTDREYAWLHAGKEGVGRSSFVSIHPSHVTGRDHRGRRQPGGEFLLTLAPPVSVRGQVVRGDGTHAAGVLVRGHVADERALLEGSARTPDIARTDEAGRFVMSVDPKVATLELMAQDGSLESHRVQHAMSANEEREVVIRFPGLIGIRGLLVDPAGRPVAGGEVVVGEKPADPVARPQVLRKSVKSDASGRFAFDLPELGAYVVLANAPGHTVSRLVDVRLDATAPRAEVLLRLSTPASLRGRVTWEDGRPIAGVTVYASTPAHMHNRWQSTHGNDLYGPRSSAVTADDGRFVLEGLHPDPEYDVACVPEPAKARIQVKRPGIRANGRMLDIVVRPEDLRSCTLAGVVLGADGMPATQFELFLVQEMPMIGTRSSMRFAAPITTSGDAQGRFAIEDLPPHGVYWLEARIPPDGKFGRGPWTLDRERIEVVLRPPGNGSVRTLVLGSDGEPATHVPVGMSPVDPVAPGGDHALPARTDHEGRVLHECVAEGRYAVSADAGKDGSATQVVEVVAGETIEVRLTLK